MIRLKLVVFLFCSIVISFAHAEIKLTDLHGQKIDFSSLRGKWVLINYWASWCQPCLDEIAELNHFYENKKDTVALFAVNFDALTVEEQLDLVKKLRIHYPNLQNDPGSQLGLEHVKGVPATFIFNPEGQLSATLYGSQTLASLTKAIGKIR